MLGGGPLPGSISESIAGKYAKHLYGTATLQDLPTDAEGPRFVLNATNVQSGVLWRFSRPFMGDYRIQYHSIREVLLPPASLLGDAVELHQDFAANTESACYLTRKISRGQIDDESRIAAAKAERERARPRPGVANCIVT